MIKIKKGFTLVELMIVITVIAILATIAVVTFTRVQKTARDSKRKEEMHSIVTALQGYYSEKSVYPISATSTAASTALTSALTTNYMSTVPTGPAGASGVNTDYMYITNAAGQTFALCATLEVPTVIATGTAMWKVSSTNFGGAEVIDAACTAP